MELRFDAMRCNCVTKILMRTCQERRCNKNTSIAKRFQKMSDGDYFVIYVMKDEYFSFLLNKTSSNLIVQDAVHQTDKYQIKGSYKKSTMEAFSWSLAWFRWLCQSTLIEKECRWDSWLTRWAQTIEFQYQIFRLLCDEVAATNMVKKEQAQSLREIARKRVSFLCSVYYLVTFVLIKVEIPKSEKKNYSVFIFHSAKLTEEHCTELFGPT